MSTRAVLAQMTLWWEPPRRSAGGAASAAGPPRAAPPRLTITPAAHYHAGHPTLPAPRDPVTDSADPWVVVATYGTVWEAEFTAETLREAGIPAQVDGGAHVALFGPGYMGGSQFGVRLRVPWHREPDARALLDDDDASDDPPEPRSEPTSEAP